MEIILKKYKFNNFQEGTKYEWIITNGLGGYASSTAILANTRRYHGLLIAKIKSERILLLSKLEEEIISDKTYQLSTNRYPDIIYPHGYVYQKEFRLNFSPTFIYELDDIKIEKEIFMIYQKNSTVISYKIFSPKKILLKIYPLINYRNYHSVTRENSWSFSQNIENNSLKIRPFENAQELILYFNQANYKKTGYWYKNMEYDREKERGLNYQEDHYNPGYFEIECNKENEFFIIAGTEEIKELNINSLKKKEEERLNNIIKNSGAKDSFSKRLVLSSDSFIVDKPKSIIAGYHWFYSWGRDTLISLPGILLTTKRFAEAKEILQNFAKFCNRGLIPNYFSDFDGKPSYNTVDASLWFFNAVYQYFKYTQDKEFIKEILPTLKEIISYYQKGTDFNIFMDKDGLIYSGTRDLQLTWMDAKIGNYVVTPRQGKAVEIQALWYNALMIMENLKLENYGDLTKKVKKNFNEIFWNEKDSCLFDVIDKDMKDSAIRPNQILSISLPFKILNKDKWKKVIDKVYKELYTPYGLRSLSYNDVKFIPHYQGSQYERDSAYHQGTVWVWPLGHFIVAYLEEKKFSKSAKLSAKKFFTPFKKHLKEEGLGTISEIFDGEKPHTPRGCISQAWSVSEILRSYLLTF